MNSKVSALMVGLLLVLGMGGTASAYSVQDQVATVSSSTVAPGGSVTFQAGGFRPGSPATITATRTDGQAAGSVDVVAFGGLGAGLVAVQARTITLTVTADSSGVVRTPVTLGAAGSWTITAAGTGADGQPLSVSTSVLVSVDAPAASTGGAAAAGSGTSGSALARTGVDGVAATAWVGFGVLVLGGLLLAVASGRGRSREQA